MPTNAMVEALNEAAKNKLADDVAYNEWWNHFRNGMTDVEFRASIRRAVLCGLNHKKEED